MPFADKLADSLIFRRIVKSMRIPDLITAWFRCFPKVVALPPYGIKYRVRAFEALLVEREIYTSDFYANVENISEIETIADLGCNRGLFSAFISSQTRLGRGVRGLMVDADAAMAEDCNWIIAENGMNGLCFTQGAAGVESEDGFVTFEIAATDVGSHVAFDAAGPNAGEKTKKARVPVLKINDLWMGHVGGDQRCHLLKVDIEGAERDFFRIEHSFLTLVDQIIVEIHHYFADPERVLSEAKSAGFEVRQHKTVAEDVSIAHLVRIPQ